MEVRASSEIFRFEDFRLDRHGGGLFRRDGKGAFAPVAVGSRGLDILGVLIARAGEVVSKDEIIAAVWPGTVVEDSNLTVQISALRRVLDQARSNGSCIQTVASRGYRFVATVTHPAIEPRWDRSPMISNGAQAEHRTSEPVTQFTIDAGERRRSLGYLLSVAVRTRRLAAIPALAIRGHRDDDRPHRRCVVALADP